MESRQAQPAAQFVGSPCRREPTCPYLRRRCCLCFHPEDETASASVVGQDQPSFVSLIARIARLELAVAQFVGVLVPRFMEDLVDRVQSAPQEPNQECRDSADAVRRQGCLAVQRQVSRPSPNHATKHAEIQPIQYINKEVEVSVVLQPQVSQTASKTAEARRSQFIDRFVSPAISQVTKHVEIPLFKYMHRTSPLLRFRRKFTR